MDPNRDGFLTEISHFAKNPLFSGIRVGGGYFQDVDASSFMADMQGLVDNDLELDVLMNIEKWDGLCALAERLPRLRIVVNHLAMTEIDGGAPDPQ